MGSHGGYKLLQDASRKIFFKDVHNLWHALQDPAIVEQLNGLDGRLDKVHLYRPWGQSVRDIAGSDRSDQQKTRSTAELCFRIYAAVMYGMAEAGGDKPWENTDSRVWKDGKTCPALLNVRNLPTGKRVNVRRGNGKKEYPRVMLGQQIWMKGKGEHRKPVELRLHRFACWLEGGDPPAAQSGTPAMALHRCGEQNCLKLSCLRWGDAEVNREHRAVHENTPGKRRR